MRHFKIFEKIEVISSVRFKVDWCNEYHLLQTMCHSMHSSKKIIIKNKWFTLKINNLNHVMRLWHIEEIQTCKTNYGFTTKLN